MVPVPVDLSNLSDVVKLDVIKKTEYDELVKKVNDIKTTDTRNLVKKADYKLTSENFVTRLAQAKLSSKDDIADFVKKHILMIN